MTVHSAFYERTRLFGQLQLFTQPRFGGVFAVCAKRDEWLSTPLSMKERGLSVSFTFLQNPASAGFLLSAQNEMNDCPLRFLWKNAAYRPASTFYTTPLRRGFLLSALEIASKGHPMHRSHDINYHICDIKHISLLSPLQSLFHICWRSQSQNFALNNPDSAVLLICYECCFYDRECFLIWYMYIEFKNI